MAAAFNGPGLRALGVMLRRTSRAIDSVGRALQGKEGYVERLVPSTRVVGFKDKTLTHGAEAFVASSATTVGDVTIGERSSLWYGSAVRGDAGNVSIGRGSAILDNALVHGTRTAPATLGSGVVVSSGAVVRSATVGDGAMIGMGAVILPGATIGADAFIDAGAVVGAGVSVPAGQLWTGSPARFLRALSPDEVKYLHAMAAELAALGLQHAAQGAKSVEDIEADVELKLYRRERRFPDGTAVPTTEPDVLEYYKLSEPNTPGSASLLRDHEYDEAAEAAAREAAEAEADAEENAKYARRERMRRVGEALTKLAGTRADRPALRDSVIADLGERDPEGAAVVRDVLARAGVADAAGRAALLAELGAVLPPGGNVGVVDALAKHAAALPAAPAAAEQRAGAP